MANKSYTLIRSQRGLAMLEYVIILGILLVVFVMIGLLLQAGAKSRGAKSAGAAAEAVPYSAGANNILLPDEKY